MDGNLHSPRNARLLAIAQRAGWFASGMAVLGVCLLFRWYSPAGSLEAKSPPSAVKKTSATEPITKPAGAPASGNAVTAPKKNPVAAIVNNEPITREDLARDCLVHYATEVLESMVNRSLIQAACQQRNVEITNKQVDDEIDRMAPEILAGQGSMAGDARERTRHQAGPLRQRRDLADPRLARTSQGAAYSHAKGDRRSL